MSLEESTDARDNAKRYLESFFHDFDSSSSRLASI